MRRFAGIAIIFSGLLLAAVTFTQQPSAEHGPAVTLSGVPRQESEPVQVIEVTAKKYEFNPEEIRVKRGVKVQLRIRAIDRTHGFKINLYPDGAKKKGAPGLHLAAAQENWKLEKAQERIIEFVAERPGTYSFKCSVFCGLGHGGMSGRLIVEE